MVTLFSKSYGDSFSISIVIAFIIDNGILHSFS